MKRIQIERLNNRKYRIIEIEWNLKKNATTHDSRKEVKSYLSQVSGYEIGFGPGLSKRDIKYLME